MVVVTEYDGIVELDGNREYILMQPTSIREKSYTL